MPDATLYKHFLTRECQHSSDAAHDLGHIQRVVTTALSLCRIEQADRTIVEAAAWLHDCVNLSKDHPQRAKASQLAARKAVRFLQNTDFPGKKLDHVYHAIEAHSFSGGVEPETPEAKIVQDADRLDALGAVGIARCMMVGGMLGRPLYHPDDPFCDNRKPDDKRWTIDHFFSKLFQLPETLNTHHARRKAYNRIQYMKTYLDVLRRETEFPEQLFS